jgi:hypothetical protein
MNSHFNQLTPAEAERLAYLIEEMGEALHIAGKVLRHGYASVNPLIVNSPDNRSMLEDEIKDVLTAIGEMGNRDDIRLDYGGGINLRWFHHQGDT